MHYAKTMELKGSNYEIGKKLGEITAGIPPLRAHMTSGWEGFDDAEVTKATALFDRWCPGLSEELQGFAHALGVSLKQVTFMAMTYLRPGCSQLALLPGKTINGHTILARNYEFNPMYEDFTLVRTSVQGRYTHIGTSVAQFGRDEGVNECGLAVSMSSCGFPVGMMEGMRHPAIRGLQFWAVIRSVLENCKDVKEALAWLRDMPIAFNLNLMVADRSGHAALIETVDGHMAIKEADGQGEMYLRATNHVALAELKSYEPTVMKHSIQRYDTIAQFVNNKDRVSTEDVKSLLLRPYPEGLCCHYYDEFFGTTKSIIMDAHDGTLEICWAGLEGNGWNKYDVKKSLEEGQCPIEIKQAKPPHGIFETIGTDMT